MKAVTHEEHHRHVKRVKLHLYTVYVFTLLLLILQIVTIYFFTLRVSSLQELLEEESFSLHRKIDGNYVDNLNKIRGLSTSVLGLESGQSQLQEQLSLVKAETSADFSGIIEHSIKSVVTVATDVAQGSGFFVTEDGYVITNAHLLTGGRTIEVFTYDRVIYPAALAGYDLDHDLALLKVGGRFESISLGDSEAVRVGEKVIAIGNPLGLSFTTTEGIISATDREGPNGLSVYIQTDVSLNPGNSGGPLINKKGEVVGINNFKLSNAEGIGFALESNEIYRVINEISFRAFNTTLLSDEK